MASSPKQVARQDEKESRQQVRGRTCLPWLAEVRTRNVVSDKHDLASRTDSGKDRWRGVSAHASFVLPGHTSHDEKHDGHSEPSKEQMSGDG